MAVDSFGQVREYVQDTNLLRLIDDYTEKHRQLEDEAASLLKEAGKPEKEPGIMATTFSWFTTGIKLTMGPAAIHRLQSSSWTDAIWASRLSARRQTGMETPTEKPLPSRRRSYAQKKN